MPKVTMIKSVQKRIDGNRQYFWAGESYDVSSEVAKEFVSSGFAREGGGGKTPSPIVIDTKKDEDLFQPDETTEEEQTEEAEEEEEEIDEESDPPAPGEIVDDPAPKRGSRRGRSSRK